MPKSIIVFFFIVAIKKKTVKTDDRRGFIKILNRRAMSLSRWAHDWKGLPLRLFPFGPSPLGGVRAPPLW